MPPLRHVLLVAGGGAVGALARVGLVELFPSAADGLPWVTFGQNVVGAFTLALVLTVLTERTIERPEVRLALGTGALGAFTTYSALAGQVTDLITSEQALLAIGYALGSVGVGVGAALVGFRLGRNWAGQGARP